MIKIKQDEIMRVIQEGKEIVVANHYHNHNHRRYQNGYKLPNDYKHTVTKSAIIISSNKNNPNDRCHH